MSSAVTAQDAAREMEEALRGRTQIGVLSQNINGRELRQDVMCSVFQKAVSPPDLVILQEANTTHFDPPADWEDYTRVAMSSASWRNQGIEIYLRKRTRWRVDLEFANNLGSALCIKVYTHDTHLFIMAVHAPQVRKVKSFGYHLYWARLWREVLSSVDPGRLLVVGDVNSAYEREDRFLERPCDTYYRQFCKLVGLRDLRDLVDIPPQSWSCVLGSGSRINTAATAEDSDVVIHDATY